MIRFALHALVALFLATALAVAGYALWLAVADRGPAAEGVEAPPQPRHMEGFAEPRAPATGSEARQPVAVEATAGARSGELRTTRPVASVALEVSGAPEWAQAIVLDGDRMVPLVAAAVPPEGRVVLRVPQGTHRVVIVGAAGDAHTRYLARAELVVPRSEPLAIDAGHQAVSVRLPAVPTKDALSERAILELATLRREGDPLWMARPDLTLHTSADGATSTPELRFEDLGPGLYRVAWPSLRAVSLAPVPEITVPGPTEIGTGG